MLAIHGGAGSKLPGVDRLCSDAIKKWRNDPVQCVVHLENDPLVNCGFGSSLTVNGRVECEAGYMCSEKHAFGAVGAVSNTRHPVLAAKYLATKYLSESMFALIPPQVVVGTGADLLVSELNLPSVGNSELKSALAIKGFENAKKAMEELNPADTQMEEKMDTVGSVYVSENGRAEACVSSGGIVLKHDGRLGHSTMFGSAIWAEERDSRSISISVSGCGEVLTRLHFAEALANFVFLSSDNDMLPCIVSKFFREAFISSPIISHFPMERRIVGGLIILRQGRMQELVAFHNSSKFSFAFWNGKSVKHYCSELEHGAPFICNSFVANF
uniref:Uncharacterized protein n=1 Tax=Panagrolaimus davidi TaxID=227884 RepID=A0A914PS57_9BILA